MAFRDVGNVRVPEAKAVPQPVNTIITDAISDADALINCFRIETFTSVSLFFEEFFPAEAGSIVLRIAMAAFLRIPDIQDLRSQ